MSQATDKTPLPEMLAHTLDRVRRWALVVGLARFPLFLIALLSVAWLLQAMADRYLSLSWEIRALLLCLDGTAVLVLLWFFVISPLRRRMDRKAAALLVERTSPDFRSSLISAVELSESGAGVSRSLLAKLLQDTTERLRTNDVTPAAVPLGPLKRQAAIAATALLLGLAGFFWTGSLSPLLIRRVFLAETALPTDTRVEDISGDLHIIAGDDVELKARASGNIPTSGHVEVTLADGKTEVVPVSTSRTEDGIFSHVIRNVREPFSYCFLLNDGRGADHRVKVRVPPVIARLRFSQIYPKYTALPETEIPSSKLRLLSGSKLKIEIDGSQELRSAFLHIKGEAAVVPLITSGKNSPGLSAVLPVPSSGWAAMSIRLVNRDGDTSVNDPVYPVELFSDRPPVVQLNDPRKERLTVVEGAKIPFVFKVTDDIGLKRVTLRYQVSRPSLGGKAEPAEKAQLPVHSEPQETSLAQRLVWDLREVTPRLTTGCVIRCWIEAEDHNPIKGASVGQSPEREIEIVSEEQKRMDLLGLMGERAKDIERLYEQQRGMNEKTDASLLKTQQ